ncbi:hypothetical protein ACFVZW_19505 [Streptomyces sp. NPDC059567]|uniref:hypothetical protein n=1 Tax=Streptomyces sp. NPDC059567 TaxID=3346867 RepID=UPI00369F1E97
MNDFDELHDDAFDEDQGDELVGEDWPTYSTPIPVWVLLAGLSPKAFKMYCFLAEHINANIRDPRKRIACPKQKAIAVILDLADDRKVARYRRELEKLGAVRVEKYRYAGGMRQGYKYFVRYNPPVGYTGPMALKQFYAANPEIRSAAKWEGRTEAAKKMAAATVPAQGSGPAAASQASKAAPAKAAKKAGGAVPLAPEVLQVLEAYRPELREAMRETAHTDAPKTLVTAVTKALKERTAEQLVSRVLRRWTTHGYAEKFETGRLERPVGAAVAMLRHGECPDLNCEDGELLTDGKPCVLCIERGKDYKASHKAARTAQKKAVGAAAARPLCPGCEQDRGTEGALCPACVSGFERDIAGAAERAAADVAAMDNAPAEWADARERVLAGAEQAREQARRDGAEDLGQLLAAQLAARSTATDVHRLRLATLDVDRHDRPQEPAPAPEPVPAPVSCAAPEPAPCSGVRWDGSPCGRATEAEDGLCGACRGAQMAQHEDLATAR